jgi:hypothetical protein
MGAFFLIRLHPAVSGFHPNRVFPQGQPAPATHPTVYHQK